MTTKLAQMRKHIAGVKRLMAAEGTPEHAATIRDYLKVSCKLHGVSGYRDFFDKVHRAFALAFPNPAKEDLLTLAAELWESEYFEEKLLGVGLLYRNSSLLTPEDLPLLEKMIEQSETWATLDTLAYHILSELLMRYPRLYPQVRAWTTSPLMWKRRAAVLCHTLPLVARDRRKKLPRGVDPQSDFARPDLFYSTCEELIAEKGFFMRKAIGWALREVGKERPQEVYEFLLRVGDRASGLTRREAVKHLPEEMRKRLLRG